MNIGKSGMVERLPHAERTSDWASLKSELIRLGENQSSYCLSYLGIA